MAECRSCPRFGDKREGYEVAAVCQLDAPADDKEPCRKKTMVAAYLRRVQFRGGECKPWQGYLSGVAAISPIQTGSAE